MTFTFDIKKAISSKKLLNKNEKARIVYKNNCSYSNYIGNCTNLYRLLKPVNYIDFYNKQQSYAEKNKNSLSITDRGPTCDEFVFLAQKYKRLVEEKTNLNYDLETYFQCLLCHVFIETFIGQHKETLIKNYIKRKGFELKEIEGKKDAKYHIDIVVKNKSNDGYFCIQVKPISFFLSKYEDTQYDRIEHIITHLSLYRKYNIPTYYIIYKINEQTSEFKFLTQENGKLLFQTKDLFEFNEKDIKSTLKVKKIPTKTVVLNESNSCYV